MIQKIKELLSKIDAPVDRGDNFNPCIDSGGNYDDCYSMGVEDGYADLAQELRDLMVAEEKAIEEKRNARREEWEKNGWVYLAKDHFAMTYDMHYQGYAIWEVQYRSGERKEFVRVAFISDGEVPRYQKYIDALMAMPFCRFTKTEEFAHPAAATVLLTYPDVPEVRSIIEAINDEQITQINLRKAEMVSESIPAECVVLDLVDEQPPPTLEELFTPEELAEMSEPAPIITYRIELANFDSRLPDEFVSEFVVPPTKEMILAAIDRLRKVFADHYVPGEEPQPGCCGPEICIMDGDEIVAFIKITAEEE